MDTDEVTDFTEFASARWTALVRAAVALGCGLHEAEDVAQATLVRCYVSWAKVSRADHRDAYVSRVLLNTHRQRHRSRRRHPELLTDDPAPPALGDPTGAVDTADALRRAVSGLSPGQREVVALRFYLHLPEAEIAATLRIAPGTVKSRLSRALAALAADPGIVELKEQS